VDHVTPTPLPGRGRDTVASVLLAHAARRPDAPFLVFEREPGDVRTISYGQMAAAVRRAAGALRRLGVERGSRSPVHLPNRPEFYELWFGAAVLGAVMVASNPLSTTDELTYLVGHAGCSVSLTQSDLAATVAATGVATVVDVDRRSQAPGDDAAPADVPPTEPLAVMYTSGTTSRPKGVLVTHAAYLHVGDVVAGHVRLRPEDRMLVVLPLFHGNPQYYSTMSANVQRHRPGRDHGFGRLGRLCLA